MWPLEDFEPEELPPEHAERTIATQATSVVTTPLLSRLLGIADISSTFRCRRFGFRRRLSGRAGKTQIFGLGWAASYRWVAHDHGPRAGRDDGPITALLGKDVG